MDTLNTSTSPSTTREIDGQTYRLVKDPRKRRRNMLAAVLDDELKAEFLSLIDKPAAVVLRELVVRYIAEAKERQRVAAEIAVKTPAADVQAA